jgi:hypothetical protein
MAEGDGRVPPTPELAWSRETGGFRPHLHTHLCPCTRRPGELFACMSDDARGVLEMRGASLRVLGTSRVPFGCCGSQGRFRHLDDKRKDGSCCNCGGGPISAGAVRLGIIWFVVCYAA